MSDFPVNAQRLDPYKNFKFRLNWDGRYVAGISKVSGLNQTIEVVKHREGGDPSTSHKSPGRTKYEAITLERGVTFDSDFAAWAASVGQTGAERSPASLPKDVTLDSYDELGQLAISYKIYECWVSEYQAAPDLDANANAVAIQHIKLENEGWDLDVSVTEPTQPGEGDTAAFRPS
jgi:phage tail-like protein